MTNLTRKLEIIEDALHEKVLSINNAINHMDKENKKEINSLVARREQFKSVLDTIKENKLLGREFLVLLDSDELSKFRSGLKLPYYETSENDFGFPQMDDE